MIRFYCLYVKLPSLRYILENIVNSDIVSAKDFLIKMQKVFPFITKQTEIQNDNGSEFMKNFEQYLKQESISGLELQKITKNECLHLTKLCMCITIFVYASN